MRTFSSLVPSMSGVRNASEISLGTGLKSSKISKEAGIADSDRGKESSHVSPMDISISLWTWLLANSPTDVSIC